MPPHQLPNFEIQKYYQNDSRFNGVSSKNNLPKTKDELIGSHWTDLDVNGDNLTCFDSFGVEHIPKEITKFVGNKKITTNSFSMQAYDSIMCT